MERFERRLFGFIRREYTGVSFYVPGVRAEAASDWLRGVGLTAGLEELDAGPAE